MLKILFTYPEEVAYERNLILNFMDEDWDYLHLRKPEFSADETRNYLELLPEGIHNKIVVHDHYELIREFDLAGININERNLAEVSIKNKQVFVGDQKPDILSASAHSFDELKEMNFETDYVFMSPVFDSISKEGYKSNFSSSKKLAEQLAQTDQRIVALGGVEESKVESLKSLGFDGYAMLGKVWEPHLKLAPWENE